MDATFWKHRWAEGSIAFHEGRPNTYLARHASRLAGATRVLVPLCGKSEDLAHLASLGHQVVGIELVEDAVQAFFAEHGATPQSRVRGEVTEYTAGTITIFAGDVFAVTAELLGPVDALYDRAALIALPPAMRGRYVAHLRRLLSPGARGLVVTLEYPPGAMEGPPFTVLESELRACYQGASVDLVDEAPAGGPRLSQVDGARERCFQITL